MKSLKSSYLKNFPYDTPRDEQIIALQKIELAFKSGKKYVVVEMPTGCGKSGVGLAVSASFERAWYVTIQKMLQDQYVSEFGDARFSVLKGKNAYQCSAVPENTCDNSICKLQPDVKKMHDCPYLRAVSDAGAAQTAMFNLHSLYYQTQFGYFRDHHRDVMVIDEAHKLETTYMSFYTIKLTEKITKTTVPVYLQAADYVPYMQELRETVATTIADLSDRRSLTERQYEYLQECVGLEHKLRNAIASIGDSEWVVQAIYGGGGVELKPLYVSTEIADTLFTLADKFVLMSATIIDVDQFCKSVGIPAKDCVFITMDSPFPITSRPIVHYDVGSLSQKNFDANGQYMIEAIEYLLKKHAGQKGIIHTHSDKLARYIQDNLDDERLLYKDGNVTAMLDEHNVRTDSVIVASGLSEGLDLKDDLARFCIICKVPYPSLGDVQIKRRMELDRKYYTYLTCLKIVQEYGRTIRTGADWSSTYILDGDFNRLPESMLPRWFLEAVVSEEDADEGLTLKKKVI